MKTNQQEKNPMQMKRKKKINHQKTSRNVKNPMQKKMKKHPKQAQVYSNNTLWGNK